MSAVAERNGRTALLMAGIGAAMLGLAFASVPLYRLLCEATGIGGTTRRAEAAPGAVAGQVAVRFDANVSPGMPWKFEPVKRVVEVAPGARTQVFYRAENLSDRPVTGTAVFNVSPDQAGKYFNKIACFCFSDQTLAPNQSVELPVTFFVDPAMAKDPDLAYTDTITLSYIPNSYSQTTISDPMPTVSAELKVTQQNNCPADAGNLCGFHEGMDVIIFDMSGNFDLFSITQVQDAAAPHDLDLARDDPHAQRATHQLLGKPISLRAEQRLQGMGIAFAHAEHLL